MMYNTYCLAMFCFISLAQSSVEFQKRVEINTNLQKVKKAGDSN